MSLVAVMDGFFRTIFHQEAFLREKTEKIISVLKGSFREILQDIKGKTFKQVGSSSPSSQGYLHLAKAKGSQETLKSYPSGFCGYS